jgi:hypothetical protein
MGFKVKGRERLPSEQVRFWRDIDAHVIREMLIVLKSQKRGNRKQQAKPMGLGSENCRRQYYQY